MRRINRKKCEKGNLTLFVLFIMLGVLLLSGLFINLTVTYLNINFSKKALEESVRSRAMAIDIPLKEQLGVVEVINYPHSGSNDLYKPTDRSSKDSIGNTIPCNGYGQCGTTKETVSTKYKETVDYSEVYAKNTMISAINSYVGTNSSHNKQPLIQMIPENICYDVQPLPKKDDDEVTFSCAVKSTSGKVFTVSKTVKIKGYNDSDLLNNVNDDTLTGTNTKLKVNNVVFGAAVIEPRALYRHVLYSFGYRADKTRTFIYSIAYPQIDDCYGDFC